jgi:uncharacterized protein (DUF885 family)
MGMTDEEALHLMEKRTFQEPEEAAAKLQRAKLSSCQLPTYLVGRRDWLRTREAYKQARGREYRLNEFNERALEAGAVPMRSLGAILAERKPPEAPGK